jgi:TonB family protein
MRQLFRIGFVVIVISAIVAVVNVGLFSLFPVLHRFFTDTVTGAVQRPQRPKVVMEYRKPEKKEPAPPQRLLKQAEAKSRSGSGQQTQLRFAFTPDLSVEGSGAVVMEQEELAAAIFEEGETDEPLIPLYRPKLTFSQRAIDLEIEGILEVLLVVDVQGKVASIEVVRSPHPSIAAEARKVIATWRFKPAKNKGVPVRVRLRQVVEFKLERQSE